MTLSMKELEISWKMARYAQIRKLYKDGVKKDELEKRFGLYAVANALGQKHMYL